MAARQASPFGERLRRLREAAGLTQEELAERAGLSRDAIGTLERGLRTRPHPQTVQALAAGLGLSDLDVASLRGAVPKRSAQLPPPAAEPGPAPLPVPRTNFVGRQRQLADLQRLLTAETVRLVTLTGPGGVGKTRLALQLAADLKPAFAGRVAFVPLGPLDDPALVLPAIAEVLGVRDAGDHSLTDGLARVLQEQRLLLVLDNFEHVIGAASRVADLLAAAPDLTVLTTSQATLRLSGEHEYPVAPLELPPANPWADLAELAATDAMTLFVHRARAAKPDFALTPANATAVAEICRRLDGLPLAIELAAARIKMFSPEALLARLGAGLQMLTGGPQDQPPRLRSMRDAVAWSYALLDPAEQTLFRRLAVFTGGFTLDAAEAVGGTGGEGALGAQNEAAVPAPPAPPAPPVPPDALTGITSLLDKSLLRRLDAEGGEPRFGMLATIQEYGLERLAAEVEEAATRAAHAAYFRDMAEQAWPAFQRRSGDQAWMNHLEAERGNLRSALGWFDSIGDVGSLLQITGALYWFWYVRGPITEGRSWLERALTTGSTEVPPVARARALLGAGMLAHYHGDDDRAVRWLNESREQSAQLDDRWWLANTLGLLGVVWEDHGDYPRAEAQFTEALTHVRAIGDRVNIAHTLNHLGIVAWGQGDVDRAAGLYAEAVELQRELGDEWGVSNSIAYLGLLAEERGDLIQAAELHRESLEIRWQGAAWEDIAGSFADLAILAVAVGRAELAARLLGAAGALLEELGRVFKLPERAAYERAERNAKTALGPEAFATATAAGRTLPREQVFAEAIALADEIARQRNDRVSFQ